MTNFNFLRTHLVANGARISSVEQPQHAPDLSTPATYLMQDFKAHAPISILASTPLDAARKLASATPTDALMVMDDHGQVVGVTSSVELQSIRVTTQALQMGLKPSELLVHDIMRSLHVLPCISLHSARTSNLGNILSTMEHQGSFYLLVTEQEQIRGIFNARKIAKAVGVGLDITPVAQSFQDVVAAVEHPH